MTMLNGCDTWSYDKECKKCQSCVNNEYCAFKIEQTWKHHSNRKRYGNGEKKLCNVSTEKVR